MEKSVLVIDDKSRQSIFKTLRLKAQNKGLTLQLFEFNPGGQVEQSLIDKNTGDLDLKKTVNRYNELFEDRIFDAIACDWNLGVTNVNGLDVLRAFNSNEVFRKTPKMMYSGTLEDEIRNYMSKIQKSTDDDTRNKLIDGFIKDIKTLVSTEFFALSGREDLSDDLLPFLLKNNSIENSVLMTLRDHPDLKFSVDCSGNFAGKTFSEVFHTTCRNEKILSDLVHDLQDVSLSYLTHIIGKNDINNSSI